MLSLFWNFKGEWTNGRVGGDVNGRLGKSIPEKKGWDFKAEKSFATPIK